MKTLEGYQICNSRGENIQGDDECPFDLPSFAIMDQEGVNNAALLLAGHDGEFLFQPIYRGTIEEPTFVSAEEVEDSYRP